MTMKPTSPTPPFLSKTVPTALTTAFHGSLGLRHRGRRERAPGAWRWSAVLPEKHEEIYQDTKKTLKNNFKKQKNKKTQTIVVGVSFSPESKGFC